MSPHIAGTLTKIGPVAALLLAIAAVSAFRLADAGVRVVGEVPRGLPSLSLPMLEPALILQLLPAAVLISLVGFVESVSVAQTLAAKRRERIEPNQELVALGGANVAAALSGGFPVTGGFARSVVNFDAGAQTPLAGALTARASALPCCCSPAIPQPAFTQCAGRDDHRRRAQPGGPLRTQAHMALPRQDAAAMAATMLGVLLIGVESGILLVSACRCCSFSGAPASHISPWSGSCRAANISATSSVSPWYRAPRPLGTGRREPLFSQRALFEDRIAELIGRHPQAEHPVLMCPCVNLIDASALESLEAITARPHAAGIQLHLSEVKGRSWIDCATAISSLTRRPVSSASTRRCLHWTRIPPSRTRTAA